MKMKSACLIVLVIVSLVFGMSTKAMALMQLALQEDAGAFTVVASGPDFTPLSFSGIFGDYNITNFGASAINGGGGSNLLSSTVSVASAVAPTHTLHMFVTQQNYTLPIGPQLVVQSGMGGTYGAEAGFTGGATYRMWADAANGAFAIPGTFSNGLQTAIPASGHAMSFDTGPDPAGIFTRGATPFSLTSRVDFTTTGIGDLNDANHVLVTPAPVPEPSTMLLLGCGLIATAAIGRRRFAKKS